MSKQTVIDKINELDASLSPLKQEIFDLIYPIGIVIATVPETKMDETHWKRLGTDVGYSLINTGADFSNNGTSVGAVLKHIHRINNSKGIRGVDDSTQATIGMAEGAGAHIYKTSLPTEVYDNVDGADANLAAGYYVAFWQRI